MSIPVRLAVVFAAGVEFQSSGFLHLTRLSRPQKNSDATALKYELGTGEDRETELTQVPELVAG
jgi:hypothetical protein